jgi:hypothetical protein
MNASRELFLSIVRAIPPMILFSFTVTVASARVNDLCSVQKIISLMPAADHLEECRPLPVSAGDKALALASLPSQGEVRRLGSSEKRKLATLGPTLQASGREGIYEVKVINVPQAWSGLYARTVLLLSLPALRILSEKEIQALLTHEIAHEYFWQEFQEARARADLKSLRRIELACDCVAASALARIGVSGDFLVSAIEKVYRYNRERFGVALNESAYPSVDERRAAIRRGVCH